MRRTSHEPAVPGECSPRQEIQARQRLATINDGLNHGRKLPREPSVILERVQYSALSEPPGVRPGPNYQLAFYFAHQYLAKVPGAEVKAGYYWGAVMALWDGAAPAGAFPPDIEKMMGAGSDDDVLPNVQQTWNAAALIGAAWYAPKLSDAVVELALTWWRRCGKAYKDVRLRWLASSFRQYAHKHASREAVEASVAIYRLLANGGSTDRGVCQVNAFLERAVLADQDYEAGFANDFANALVELFDHTRDVNDLRSAWAESGKAVSVNTNDALVADLWANQIRIAGKWASSGQSCPWLHEYLQRGWDLAGTARMTAEAATRLYANLADVQVWDYTLNAHVTALDKAVEAGNRAAAAARGGGQRRGFLESLGQGARANAYSKRFQLTQDPRDEQLALEAYGKALADEDDPHRVAHLLSDRSNLRVSRQAGLKEMIAAADDIDQAVSLEPGGCPAFQRTLEAAARVHLKLFEINRDADHLRRALGFGEQSLTRTAPDDPERGRRLHLIGEAVHALGLLDNDQKKLRKALDHFDAAAASARYDWDRGAFRHYAAGAAADLANALRDPALLTASRDRYRTIARDTTAPATTRWDSAESSAQLSMHLGDKEGALADLDQGVEILYALAWRGRPVAARFAELEPRSTTVMNAVHLALDLGEVERALQIAERGRAVVWQELLDLRSLDGAEPDQPEMRRARDVARRLHQLEYQLAVADAQQLGKSAVERIEMDRRATDAEWQMIRGSLAASPGQQRPTVAGISAALSEHQSVVIVCPGADSGFALHLPSGRRIALEGLTSDACEALLSSFAQSFTDFLHERSPARREALNHRCRSLLEWTWSTVSVPVLAACDDHRGAARLHELFWYALGPAALLPLHSASAFSPDGAVSDSVLDRTVSASLVSLLPNRNATDDGPIELHDWRVLAAPEAVGLDPLDGSREECRAVAAALGIPQESLSLEATANDLLHATAHAKAIHVACHGNPMSSDGESSVSMTDRQVGLSEIAFAERLSVQWAFISACSSANAPLGVADQGASLASGLAALGCPNVIGTLWQLSDKPAAHFARLLHEDLSSTGLRHPSYTALAVRNATRQMRDAAEAFPVLWAGYQHITHLKARAGGS